MPRKPSRPRRSIGALMGKTHQAFNRELTALLRERGHTALRPASAQVFRGLDREGTTVTDLAQRAEVTKQTMWVLVRELEQAGYVRLGPHPVDGRAKLVHLTASGRRLAEDIQASASQVESRVASRIGARRLAKLREDLEGILAALGETYRTDWYR